jgi:hypothetical protein
MRVDRVAGARGALIFRMVARRWLAACTALLIVSWATTAAAAICYVNGAASGANTGASWTDGYTDLQSALGDANCTEVWVAQGIYKPTATTNQTLSFNIGPNVAVYGGFSGTETSLTERDPAAHVTILSADLDNNDDSNNADGNFIDESSADIVGSNSHHIVVMNGTTGTPITATTVLDGFTLTGGDNSASGDPTEGGGALWCKGAGAGHACSPTLATLVFSGNKAKYGGALALEGYSGGASNPTLTNVTFSGNSAGFFAGAMYNNAQAGGTCSPTLTNVIFNGNSSIGSPAFGGAMVDDGGGTSSPTLTNVTFSGNSASSGAGAMMINGASGTNSPTLTNVTFSGNQTISGSGGAMYFNDSSTSSPILTNVTFYGNSANSGNGGAIYHSGNNGDFSLKLINATSTGNSASNGGAIYNTGANSYPLLLNSIVWGDSATTSGPELFSPSGGITLYYGILQGGCPANCGGTSIFTGDPLLGALADNGGFTRTLAPGPSSPAINAVPCSYSSEEPVTDQRGAVRPDSASSGATRCDIGAVEADSLPGDLIFADRFGSSPWDDF